VAASVALRDAAGELRALPRRDVIRAVKAVKQIAADEVRYGIGDPVMSNFGKRGARLRTRDTITGSGQYVFATVRGLPAGPWKILDQGSQPHLIGVGRARGRATSLAGGYKKKRRYLAGRSYAHPVIGPVFHPGSSGRHTWRRVKRRAAKEIPAMFAADVARIVRR
jgi:hypothetical protein